MEDGFGIKMSHVAIRILIAIHIDRLKGLLSETVMNCSSEAMQRQCPIGASYIQIHCQNEKRIDSFIQEDLMSTLHEILFLAQDHHLEAIACKCEKAITACCENNRDANQSALENLLKAMTKEIS
ncbi:hypothetical protein [Chromobacterium violaceum]|uniref:hypothetical protein n=1 Tax=Chromobacterium violaceum TaxID=536 RepID=UPI0005D2D834|nr:hypothetical protein [Chromobacterium violaceum]KJH67115.1 hypothetical protein UF16_12420 [Chromobacterium violaceum]MBP4050084.1 hypothetical protein [Chromobacterium violaceum]